MFLLLLLLSHNRFNVKIFLVLYRKLQSESGDDDTKGDHEEVSNSDSTSAETKPVQVPTDDDNEQVDSSTTDPIASDVKEADEKSETEKVDDDKKENLEGQADTPAAKKKAPSRKRPSKSSKSPRSSK